MSRTSPACRHDRFFRRVIAGVLVLIGGFLASAGRADSGASTAIDFNRPVENMGHDPDAAMPSNPRNLLAHAHGDDAKWLKSHLLGFGEFHPYPTIAERDAWEKLPPKLSENFREEGEQLKKKPWEVLPASLFLNYLRNGNRSAYSEPFGERQTRLQHLVLSEMLEAKGNYLDAITDGIWLICEETYWGEPAHIPQMQRSGTGLPNVKEPTIELFAAERGAALAWTNYLLGDRLDKISPFVRERIDYEIDRRIFAPFLRRDDFWWMGLRERKDLNNWTPWIVSNILTCALLNERDQTRRAAIVAKCIQILDRYLNLALPDGGCDEGPSYWQAAGGSLFDCLELLYGATAGALDVYREPLIHNIGHFICDAHVAGDWALNFGDGSARSRPNAALVYRFGQRTGDRAMQAYGAWIAQKETFADLGRVRSLGRQLAGIFKHDEMLAADAEEPLPRELFLPDLQMAAARETAGSTAGLYFGIKGHHNAESHNHNDVGSFMLYMDGQPVLIDAGVETYTTRTFSPERYEIWTMQSAYHNLPTINGRMQEHGQRFAASDVAFHADEKRAEIEMDLSHAYPPEAYVTSWKRRLALIRGQAIVLTEKYQLSEVRAPLVLNFMTACTVDTAEKGKVVFTTHPKSENEKSAKVVMQFDPSRVRANIEEIKLEDRTLTAVWGNALHRVQLIADHPKPSGTLEIEFKKP